MHHEMGNLPTYVPPPKEAASDFELWMRLDAWTRLGVTEDEFNRLMGSILKCACGLVMSSRRFRRHECTKIGQEVIDLADDTDTDTGIERIVKKGLEIKICMRAIGENKT